MCLSRTGHKPAPGGGARGGTKNQKSTDMATFFTSAPEWRGENKRGELVLRHEGLGLTARVEFSACVLTVRRDADGKLLAREMMRDEPIANCAVVLNNVARDVMSALGK